MSVTIKPEQLAATVNKYLQEFGDEATKIMDEVITEATKEAKAEVQSSGKYGDVSGKYRRSWKTKIEKSRLSVTGIVYNAKPRPLEFGHVLRRGGRTIGSVRPHPHMEPVNRKAQEEVLQKLEERLRG